MHLEKNRWKNPDLHRIKKQSSSKIIPTEMPTKNEEELVFKSSPKITILKNEDTKFSFKSMNLFIEWAQKTCSCIRILYVFEKMTMFPWVQQNQLHLTQSSILQICIFDTHLKSCQIQFLRFFKESANRIFISSLAFIRLEKYSRTFAIPDGNYF